MLAFAVPLLGQKFQVTPVMGSPGEPVSLAITWDAPDGGIAASSLQWDTVFPAQLVEVASGIEPEAGGPAVEAGKTLKCGISKPYSYTCLLVGGPKAIPSGLIATLHFQIKADAHAGQSAFRIEKGEAVASDQSKINLQDGDASIIVRALAGGTERLRPDGRERLDGGGIGADPAQSAAHATGAYLALEPFLHEIHGAWQTLDYKHARDLLSKAQEALHDSEVASLRTVRPAPAPPRAPHPASGAPEPVPPSAPRPANPTPEPAPQVTATSQPATAASPGVAQPAAEPDADKTPAGLHDQRGRELNAKYKFKEAIQELDQAIQLRPDFYLALNARGFAHYMLKEYADALKDLNEAIRLNPKYQNAYRNRSAVRAAMGDARGAAEDKARARQSK